MVLSTYNSFTGPQKIIQMRYYFGRIFLKLRFKDIKFNVTYLSQVTYFLRGDNEINLLVFLSFSAAHTVIRYIITCLRKKGILIHRTTPKYKYLTKVYYRMLYISKWSLYIYSQFFFKYKLKN